MGYGIVGRAEETELPGMKSHIAERGHKGICILFHEPDRSWQPQNLSSLGTPRKLLLLLLLLKPHCASQDHEQQNGSAVPTSQAPHCTETTAEATLEKAGASGTCLPVEV